MPPATSSRPGPLSFPGAAFRVARIAPFHTLRGRRLISLAVLLALPILVATVFVAYGRTGALGLRGFLDMLFGFYFGISIPMTMLFLGAGAIGDDMEDGTILYLRLRPVPRPSIVFGRYLALWLSGLTLIVPAVTLLYAVQVGSRGGGARPNRNATQRLPGNAPADHGAGDAHARRLPVR